MLRCPLLYDPMPFHNHNIVFFTCNVLSICIHSRQSITGLSRAIIPPQHLYYAVLSVLHVSNGYIILLVTYSSCTHRY